MDEETIVGLERKHLADVYERLPVAVVKGKGALLWDSKGQEYIDCMGGYGVALVGHCNPRVVEAIKRQAETLITCHGSVYNDVRAELLERLVRIAPKGLGKVYLCNSGAEAVECAIKLARKRTGKHEIIAVKGSYHGKTLGALSATWDRKYRGPFEPLIPGIRFATFGKATEVEEVMTSETGAIMVEPVQGESGVRVPPDGYLAELREICNRNDALLIFDEVQCGLGRTGRMWASEHWSVEPDIMCIAKGMAGGVPMGATLATDEVMSAFRPGDHTTTFGGGPLACAASSATIDCIVKEDLVERAARLGGLLKEGLEGLRAKHRIVRDVRGLGLMLAMELRFDIKNILLEGIRRGVILLYSGRNILRLLPPLVIAEDQILKVLKTLDVLLLEEERARRGT